MRDAAPQPPSRLKLHAVDGDDLQIVSAALSGAAIKRGDLGFDRRARRFALVGNRFRWEGGAFPDGGGSRIRTGIQINDIEAVSQLGLADVGKETVLELLAIELQPDDEPPGATLILHFAGGAAVRLSVGCIDVLVDDMGRAWYTPNRPQHEDDATGQA